MTKTKALQALAIIALALSLNAIMAFVTMPHGAPVAVTPDALSVDVAEDDPAFNCYTMGNNVCGVDTYIESEHHGRGAVLSAASDGRVYVSWQDGTVTRASEGQRLAAWQTCVDYATGGDASLQACDAAYPAS